MPHPLENEYDLTATELLDAIDERFRLKVALAGAVAEVQAEKKLRLSRDAGGISRYEEHDTDGYPDFTLWLPDGRELKMEVKNVRDSEEAYRAAGQVVAYKVETQKTRASTADASSRLYEVNYFQVLAVCLGIKTGNYTDFLFASTSDLERSSKYPDKLRSMQRVPLPGSMSSAPELTPEAGYWREDLGELLRTI